MNWLVTALCTTIGLLLWMRLEKPTCAGLLRHQSTDRNAIEAEPKRSPTRISGCEQMLEAETCWMWGMSTKAIDWNAAYLSEAGGSYRYLSGTKKTAIEITKELSRNFALPIRTTSA